MFRKFCFSWFPSFSLCQTNAGQHLSWAVSAFSLHIPPPHFTHLPTSLLLSLLCLPHPSSLPCFLSLSLPPFPLSFPPFLPPHPSLLPSEVLSSLPLGSERGKRRNIEKGWDYIPILSLCVSARHCSVCRAFRIYPYKRESSIKLEHPVFQSSLLI